MPAHRHGRVRSGVVLAVGLALVALPGFALGLLAGVGWEEPSLLLSHLLGRSEEVSWEQQAEVPPESPPAALPDVAARAVPAPPPVPATPPAPAAAAAAPAAAPPAASATRMRPEVLSPGAPAAGRFAVQVGAFGENSAAEQLAKTLRGKGFSVYVSPGASAAASRWRVRVGPYPSRPEAEAAAGRLKAEERLPTWVLDENGPA